MDVFRQSVVVLVAMLLLMGGECRPGDWHWQPWRQVQLRVRQQQREQQQQQQLQEKLLAQQQTGWRVRDARERQLLQEQLQELQMEMQDEMREIVSGNDLEDLALHMGVDALGSILRPLREQPTQMPIDDCITRRAPVTFAELNLFGEFVYTACGYGDGAAIHLRFQEPGDTTPSLDTTTPVFTTVGTTTQHLFPVCLTPPPAPTTPPLTPTTSFPPTTTDGLLGGEEAAAETPAAAETTTTRKAEDATTAEPETTTPAL